MSGAVALAARVCSGAALASFTISALAALPLRASAAAFAVVALTLWSPVAGLIGVVSLAPAGLLLADPPARAAELLVWAFIAAWLLSVWRPLGHVRRGNPATSPAALFALCAVTSWLAHIIGSSGGVEPLYLPAVAARALALDHLVFSSPEPETFTLLPLLAGLALFAAAAAVTRARPAARFGVAAAIAVSAGVLSMLTIADVLRQWAEVEYGGWFLLRYVRGERFSLHLADLNAAGSQYVLGALSAAALAVFDSPRRGLWVGIVAAIAPALWISGSRSASLGALLVGGSLIPVAHQHANIRLTRRHGVIVLAAAAVLLVAVGVAASQPPEQGTASNALRLRAHFLVTSARMFASAPVFGVGIGHYHQRSNEFMPPELRQVYGHENAHNYFAQQFAELGVVGGLLFVWLVVAVLSAAWRSVRTTMTALDAASIALIASTGGYLLTCVTGHPLLVPEAAMPFWGVFGALASVAAAPVTASAPRGAAAIRRWAAIAAIVLACTNVALQLRRYALTTTPPGESGFYPLETETDGRMFVWMTRHGVFHVGAQAGTVTIPVRAPDFLEGTERFVVAVDVGGRRAGVYEAVPDRWTMIEVPVRRPATTPFRRIDLRANRSWSPLRQRQERTDDRPRSIMVGETKWTPAGGR